MIQYYIFIAMAITHIIFPTNLYLIYFKNYFKFWPTSYSSTYGHMWDRMMELWEKYKVPKHITHIFTAWTGSGVILLSPLLILSDTTLQLILAISSLMALIIVGACPTSVNKEVTKIHCASAKFCAGGAILWLFLKGFYTSTLILCIGGLIWSRVKQKKYECLIMEYMAFLSADIGVIFSSLQELGIM